MGCIQMLLIQRLFLLRRFKKGMPFLYHSNFKNSGFFLCILLLLSSVLYRTGASNYIKAAIYATLICSCGFLLFLCWFKRLRRSYLEKLKAKEIESLKLEVLKLQEEVSSLKQNNSELSKLIHKDNKLIPAMEYTVKALSESAVFPDEAVGKQAKDLLERLDSISKERNGILTSYESTYKHATQTGVISIDAMCQYMAQKALAQGVSLQFAFVGSVKYLTDTIIDENKLTTLIADLLENALIAMKTSENKSALLSLGIENDIYTLSIYDSGVAFEPETIRNFGIKRFTTHQKDGGSGIGLMTIYEILGKYKASFILDETIKNSTYTKVISICYDGLSQVRIKSIRPEIVSLSMVRGDFIFEN